MLNIALLNDTTQHDAMVWGGEHYASSSYTVAHNEKSGKVLKNLAALYWT